MAGILDILTGGKSNEASSALKRAEAAFANIQAPTAEQLTLPELQKYVEMGILTPAEAKAALVQGNAFNDMNIDPSSLGSEKKALAGLENVGDASGMTDEMKAQLASALDQVATTTRGNNAGILDQAAQRGVSTSLLAPAAMIAESGDAARQANLNTTQAAGQAEQNAINAMMASGNLSSTIHGQQANEAEQKAQAENALRQWNAGTQTGVNEANAGRTMAANTYNTQNTQNLGNANVENANKRTEYNATVPQSVFNNAVTKASGQSGVNQTQANNATSQGNSIMGLYGAGIGAASKALAPDDTKKASSGLLVPGKPEVSGDSPKNDKVHAMLSPGEVVVPRSIAPHPEAVKNFVTHLMKNKPVKPVHPDDVHAVLSALEKRRG